MDVSIIIINYNTTALTRQCIASVIDKTRSNTYEIIVIDNASADRSVELLAEEFPLATFIFNESNEGFGRANNHGIKMAKGKYVFLLNSDTYLLNDVIAIFYDYMELPENHSTGCCGGDLFGENGQRQVSYGNFPSLAGAISDLGFKVFYKNYFKEHLSSGIVNDSAHIKDVDYLCGADMLVRRSMLDKTGVFNPGFFLYFEETELSFRMKNAGYRSVLIPDAKIVHLEGASQKTLSEFNFGKIETFSRSRNLFFRLCYGSITAWLIKYIYGLQALIFFFVKRKKGYLKSAGIIIRS